MDQWWCGWDNTCVEFGSLLGVVLSSVEKIDDDVIVFKSVDGSEWAMLHHQDCCESVYIESVVGELQDLVGSPITFADESSDDDTETEYGDISGWTFYKLATANGWVDIRWSGSSNGYYSIGVDFVKRGK